MNQLLTCSTGGHLDSTADFAGMHTSTVSRIVSRATEAIAQLGNNMIRSPRHRDTIRKMQQKFYDIAAFPRVIGAIDWSHFKEKMIYEIYRNRKGYFSVNAQFVTDADLKILNV
ncbi:hypothetical protein QE152_g38305 [Popillia japonica]|uniref:Nuclease HARBI1 n=1 Tax=Popillia japonica TaxID=7064 RepID=A0AAW1I8B1_POPJA